MVPATTSEEEGGFSLVLVRSGSETPLSSVTRWLRDRVKRNNRLNIETSVLVFQDILPHRSIRSIIRINPELVHFFIFSQSSVSSMEFTFLKLGELEIGTKITEISREFKETRSRGEIIIIDLSILINTFSVHRAYNLLLNKMRTLRMNRTSLAVVVHEKIHEEQEIALFKAMAENVITL